MNKLQRELELVESMDKLTRFTRKFQKQLLSGDLKTTPLGSFITSSLSAKETRGISISGPVPYPGR